MSWIKANGQGLVILNWETGPDLLLDVGEFVAEDVALGNRLAAKTILLKFMGLRINRSTPPTIMPKNMPPATMTSAVSDAASYLASGSIASV